MLDSGITIVGKGAKIPPGIKIGRNSAILCDVMEDDFTGPEVPSGETVKPKQRRT